MQKLSDNEILELLDYPTEDVTFEDIAPGQFISGSIKVIKKTFKVPNDGNSLSGGYDEVEFDYEVSIDK